MNTKWTKIWLNDIDIRDCFGFLLRGFISGKRVPVYPVWGVFLVEIRGKNEELYALEATKFPLSRWERAARQPAGWRAG